MTGETKPSAGLPVSNDLRRMLAELAEMFTLRRKLAEHELRGDLATSKRLGILGALGVAALVIGVAVLVAALAISFDLRLNLSAEELPSFPIPWTSLATAAVLIVIGALMIWSAWRGFRRDISGMRESIAELREDLVWLRDWLGKHDDPQDGESA